ncbi:MAG TPA: hypothetical protein VD886_09000 [Herpetosiphonaceae bacterium]|nr:hypothetical protein [Herpetosiphonaceae bacterium]
MEKHYDRAALIQAYIETQRERYLHDDFKRFSAERLAALERPFDVRLTLQGATISANKALWMLFHATAKSYLSIRTPRSYFLEDTIVNDALDRLGDQAAVIGDHEALIGRVAETSREAHLAMLDELFKLLWGEIDAVFTSAQLRQSGFDDSREPKRWDYIDYM